MILACVELESVYTCKIISFELPRAQKCCRLGFFQDTGRVFQDFKIVFVTLGEKNVLSKMSPNPCFTPGENS